jgi:flagellar assembly protein FliH
MSSSPSRAPIPPSAAGGAASSRVAPEVLPFSYAEATLRPGQHNFPLNAGRVSAPPAQKTPGKDALANAASDLEREGQARELGRQQGLQEARAKLEEQVAAARSGIAGAVAEFARDRAGYYRKIEEETVRLALAIARKVIHREAQVDPPLLMGIARVAMERMEGATGVTLRVNPQEAGEWRNYLASQLPAGQMPEIVEDAGTGPQQCALKTSMGTADLGLETQLKEIEKGLMDLLAARPGEQS